MKATRCQIRHYVTFALLAAGLLFIAPAAFAATLKVTNTGDDGPGSLRAAITTANNKLSTDTIVFELRFDSTRTISLFTALPDITSDISILNTGAAITVRRSTSLRTPSFPIFTITPGHTVVMEGLVISGGNGGVRNHGSTLSMRNCTLDHNSNITGGGAAIDNYSIQDGNANGPANLTLTNCTLTDNSASRGSLYSGESGGGAIRNLAWHTGAQATATLTDCVLRQNSTVYEAPPEGSGGLPIWSTPPGGAVANIGMGGGVANLSLTRCTLESNSTPVSAGAIYNDGIPGTAGTAANLRMVDCTLHNNSAANGGALKTRNPSIDTSALVSIENCTFADNQAAGNGGAIVSDYGLALTNCTFSQNSAGSSSTDSGGAAIYNSAGTTSATNCTFFGKVLNGEGRGQSVFNKSGATFSPGNSLFKAVSPGVNFVNAGLITSRGHNLCNDNAGGPISTAPGGWLNAAGDQRVTEPKLNALADNGGLTQTCALQSTSPAINAGDDTIAPPTDQRGRSRSGISDIGAYELSSTTPVSLKPGRLGNIATRLIVGTGDSALIGGFIVTGTDPKKVMLRAIGPSLPFANRLANPTLELYDSKGELIEANDNWVDSENKQAIIDSTIPPSNDLESAIVGFLPANSSGYTAVVRGGENGTGIGVIEVYDLDDAANSKLANISTRGLVQTGDNVLIAGTIAVGQSSQKVIIRAIGPSLPIVGRLENPTVELRDGNGVILAANDNWRTGGQEAEIINTGVPPSNDLEAAIVYQLPTNNASYTAIVRGVGDTTGIAVVEVYALGQLSVGP